MIAIALPFSQWLIDKYSPEEKVKITIIPPEAALEEKEKFEATILSGDGKIVVNLDRNKNALTYKINEISSSHKSIEERLTKAETKRAEAHCVSCHTLKKAPNSQVQISK